MPIQGASADFIKLAMVKIDKKLEEAGLKDEVKMLLQIHDELLFEIKEEKIVQAVPIIKEAMESVYPAKEFGQEKDNLPKVPLAVNVETGDNWGRWFLADLKS